MVTKAPTYAPRRTATLPPTLTRNVDQSAMARALEQVPGVATATASESPGQKQVSEYVVGMVYPVPLFRLARSDNNARVFYSSEEIDETSKSLVEEGQKVPAIGYVRGGKVVLVDGQKRSQAATSAGLECLDVLIKDPPESDAAEYEDSRRINLLRSTQSVLDDALRWNDMLKKGAYKSQDELAARMGTSIATVSKVIAIAKIPERIIRQMTLHDSTKSLSTAYEISQIFEHLEDKPEEAERVAEAVVERIVKDELNRDLAKQLINEFVSPKAERTRVRAESNPVRFGESKGTLKVFASRGQLDLSFRGLEPEKVDRLKDMIERMLAGQS